jgi:hypothetical protein
VVAVLAALVGGAAILVHRPVLFHAFVEDACACGEYYKKVTGVVLWNPFRDRSPENTAKAFFQNLRSGKCFEARELCDHGLDRYRVSDWYLANREDSPNSATLYFKLTKYGESDPKFRLTGVGLLELRKGVSGWRVANYDSVF